jgi:hypothetical protein
MIHRFLSAKHWHLFMLVFVFPLLIQGIMMITAVANVIHTNDPQGMFVIFYYFPVLMIVIMFGTYGWQWSVAVGLHSKLPTSVSMNLRQFKIFFVFPILYVLIFIFFMLWYIDSMTDMSRMHTPEFMPRNLFGLLLAMITLMMFGLFTMFCMGYCLYFCAKTVRSIELGREAVIGEYIGDFFLFYFNIVGVWIIQPRVNLIYSDFPDHPPGIAPEYPINSPSDFTPPPPRIPQDYNREKLRGKDHDAFRYDDEFDGII